MDKKKISTFIKNNWKGFIAGGIIGYILMRFVFH